MSESTKIDTVFDDESMHVGSVYAKALLEAAKASGNVDVIVDQFETIVNDLLAKNPAFELFLANPKISVEEKTASIDRVFAGRIDDTLLKFLKVVARRRRLISLPSIQQTASKLRDEAVGRVQVTVTTAAPIDDASFAALKSKLEKQLNAQVAIKTKIDPVILGGLIVRVGDLVFDGSVDGQLKTLKKQTIARTEQAIRDKRDTLAS